MTWISEEDARMMDEEMHSRYVRWQRANEEARFREVVHPHKSEYRPHKSSAWDVFCFWAVSIGVSYGLYSLISYLVAHADAIDRWGR